MRQNGSIVGKYSTPNLGPASGIHSLSTQGLRVNGDLWPINTASLPYTTNLFAHFDAADGATIFDSNSGGSQTANNGAVGRWEDKSGNGRHLVQATANNRPVLRENNRAGRAGIEFDGSNDGMTFTSTLTSAMTFFYVINFETSNKIPFKEDDSNNFFGYIHTGSVGSSQNAGSAHRYYTNGRELNDFDYLAEQRWMRLWTFSNGAVATCIKNLALNTWSGLGVGGYSSFMLDGFVYEIIIYNEAINDANRITVERYLRSKWQTG